MAALLEVGSPGYSAGASTCTTSWKNTSGGTWDTATNWSAGVPTSASDVCIVLAGTYTVVLSGTRSVHSFAIGGSSGKQVLSVRGKCGANGTLTLAADSRVNPFGVVVLSDTTGGGCGDYLAELNQSSGTLTNDGTIHSLDVLNGTDRYLKGNVTNNGSLIIDRTTSAFGSIVNNGTVLVADDAVLSAHAFANNAGTIEASGSGSVDVEFGTFAQGNGTTSGTSVTPIAVGNTSLHFTGNGASSIVAHGSTPIEGSIAAGQTLTLVGTDCGSNAVLSASVSWTNAGTINLMDTSTCLQGSPQLSQTAGTLTNAGTINAGSGSTPRYLDGDFVNSGTIAVASNLVAAAVTTTQITNTGTVDVADGGTLTILGRATFVNAAGTVSANGTGTVLVQHGSYVQGDGTTSGPSSNPVSVVDGSLHYTGAGASVVTAFGGTTVDGNVAEGQTFDVEARCGYGAIVTAPASWTNAGTINLGDAPDDCGAWSRLQTTSGTLTNLGTIAVAKGTGSRRYLFGALENLGTLKLEAGVTLHTGHGPFSNAPSGTIETRISSRKFGRIVSNSAVYLSGTLHIVTATSPKPQATFAVITCSACITNAFDTYVGRSISDGLKYAVKTTADAVTLIVKQK